MEYDSILIIPVSEAEQVAGTFRYRYDPSAAKGMPAHITINYPFIFPNESESEVIDCLKELFSGFSAFEFSLVSLGRFHGVLYLEPSPRQPFVELIQTVAENFPDSPPYGGQFKEINPHLTLAQVRKEATIDQIINDFIAVYGKEIPLKAKANQVCLMDNATGMWIKRASFALENRLCI